MVMESRIKMLRLISLRSIKLIEIIFHLFNYELEASLVDEAAEDLDLWDWNDL